MANGLTEPALENAAKAFALACNGGVWETDYTEKQRNLWRKRASAALAVL